MTQHAVPYVLEDRTGQLYDTDFDDAYDRLFLRVVEHGARPPLVSVQSFPPTTLAKPVLSSSPPSSSAPRERNVVVYDMSHRWSPRRASAHSERIPAAVLRLGPGGDLGSVQFRLPHFAKNMLLSKWMPRTGYFAGHLSRHFAASNGRHYQWAYRTTPGHDWVCADEENGSVCAYYDAHPPREPGNHGRSSQTLRVLEEYGPLAVELLCALIVMRHIQISHP